MALTALLRLALGSVGLLLLLTTWAILRSRRDPRLPPGPPGLPILGNALQLPRKKSYLKMQEWAKEYGDIFSLKIGSGTMIVLSSAEHVSELFDKRGAIYSSRPPSYLMQQLLAPGELHLLLMSYTPQWRHTRKVFMSVTNVTVVDRLQPLQAAEATQTMKDLCETPHNFSRHLRRNATSVILSSVFGKRGADYSHPDVKEIYRVQDQFTEIIEPGNIPPIDSFRILRYVPAFLANWKQRAAAVRKGQQDLYMSLLKSNQARLARGIHVNCFMDRLLSKEGREKHQLDDEHLAYVGGVMMEAGSDTTSATLSSFVLAMVKNPQVLKKAQREVDEVCGDGRSPTFEDLSQLPYIRACVLETLRWRPAAPAALPHMLMEDDWYRGYFLPKGSLVVSNILAIHQNVKDYDDPEHFHPERFLDNEYGTKSTGSSYEEKGRRTIYTFGAGRRVCPGQHLAENALRINIAKMVWSFDFLPPVDPKTGKEVPTDQVDADMKTAFVDGVSAGPKPFPCQIIPRSAKRVEVLKKDFEEAHVIFDQYDKA